MRLDVAVDNAVGMIFFQGFGDIEGNVYLLVDRQVAVFFDVFF